MILDLSKFFQMFADSLMMGCFEDCFCMLCSWNFCRSRCHAEDAADVHRAVLQPDHGPNLCSIGEVERQRAEECGAQAMYDFPLSTEGYQDMARGIGKHSWNIHVKAQAHEARKRARDWFHTPRKMDNMVDRRGSNKKMKNRMSCNNLRR